MVAKQSSAEGSEKPKKKRKEKSVGQGIQSFFSKVDNTNGDRQQTPEAAKVPNEEDPSEATSQPQPKPLISRKRKAPTLKVVEPPIFHPVRASIPDSSFLHHLKVREFVLRCIPLLPIELIGS